MSVTPQPKYTNPQSEIVTHKLTYHKLAQFIGILFSLTMVVAGAVTFTATKYDPSTDLIYRFYQTFNPCIFFDHFPANLVAIIGISMLAVVQTGMVLIIWIRRFVTFLDTPEHERPLSFLLFSICLGPIMFGYLFFINVFTSNLYDHDTAYTPHNVSNYEGLLNVTRDEREGLPKDISIAVVWHSLWFVFYIAADILFAMFVWSYAANLRSNPKTWAIVTPPVGSCRHSKCWRIVRVIVCCLYFFGVILFAMGMILMCFHAMNDDKGSEPGYRWGFGYIYKDAPLVQKIVSWVAYQSKAALWSAFCLWVPGHSIFVFPKSVGIEVTLSLAAAPVGTVVKKRNGPNGLHLSLHPTVILSCCVQMLTVLILLTMCFEKVDSSSSATVSAVATGLRVRPWSFVFAPAWLVITMSTCCAIYVSIVRLKLMHGQVSNLRRYAATVVGVVLVIVMFLGLWAVVPQVTSTKWIGSSISILFPIFIILAYVGIDAPPSEKRRSHVVFSFLCFVCGVVSIFSVIGTFLLLILMSCVGTVFTWNGGSLQPIHVCIVPSSNLVVADEGDAGSGVHESASVEMEIVKF